MSKAEMKEMEKKAVNAEVQDVVPEEQPEAESVPETPEVPAVEVKKNVMQIAGDWIQSKQIAKAEKKAAKKAKAEEKKAKKDKLVTAAAWIGGLAVAGRVAVSIIDAVGRNHMDDEYPTEEIGDGQETLELPENTESGTAEEIPAEVNEET